MVLILYIPGPLHVICYKMLELLLMPKWHICIKLLLLLNYYPFTPSPKEW